MRKFINWASVIFICALIYSILSTYISILPILPIGEWDLLPSLAVIAAGISGYKLIRSKKYINLIDSGKISHFPAIMAALEIADNDMYKIILRDYSKLVMDKINELNTYIEDERRRCYDEFKDNKTVDFNVTNETKKLDQYKALRNTLSDIKRHKITWEEIYQNLIKSCNIRYTEKFLLGELPQEDVKRINADISTINKLRDGGDTVNI